MIKMFINAIFGTEDLKRLTQSHYLGLFCAFVSGMALSRGTQDGSAILILSSAYAFFAGVALLTQSRYLSLFYALVAGMALARGTTQDGSASLTLPSVYAFVAGTALVTGTQNGSAPLIFLSVFTVWIAIKLAALPQNNIDDVLVV